MSVILMSNQSFRASDSAEIRRSSADTHDVVESELFSREELRQFADDDSQAGRQIGAILCSLFIYPLVVMTGVIWWTFRTLGY